MLKVPVAPMLAWVLIMTALKLVLAEEPWRFITLADWHGAEGFVTQPIPDAEGSMGRDSGRFESIQTIHNDFGGELVLLPGDSNSGKWHEEKFLELFDVDNSSEAVLRAGKNCYQSMTYLFAQAGYQRILMALGDHEIGGNPWPEGAEKTTLLPVYRQAFTSGFNRDQAGNFLYSDPIGNADSRPLGTMFENTSYAFQYKNVLFVTVDAFKTLPYNFYDQERGLGGEGSVTCTVDGAHLEWFKNVLKEGRKDPTIRHIMVQAHLPILQPIRKVSCSGQFMDYGEQSPFWETMVEYGVDVYFAGEVHTNTATKASASNSSLLQVVSRGNVANNFLTVDITDDVINITSFNEVGMKPKFNGEYIYQGSVAIDMRGGNTTIKSDGVLALLDRSQPMIHLTFDELFLLKDRPVISLKHDAYEKTLVQQKITIRNVECRDSFPNYGAYGQQYDAQVGHVELEEGVRGKAAIFNSTSRVAIWGIGPHSGGNIVSYAVWFKTTRRWMNQILIHFGVIWPGLGGSKNVIFTLTLDRRGLPMVYAASKARLAVVNDINLADGEWNHVAISMPRQSCRRDVE